MYAESPASAPKRVEACASRRLQRGTMCGRSMPMRGRSTPMRNFRMRTPRCRRPSQLEFKAPRSSIMPATSRKSSTTLRMPASTSCFPSNPILHPSMPLTLASLSVSQPSTDDREPKASPVAPKAAALQATVLDGGSTAPHAPDHAAIAVAVERSICRSGLCARAGWRCSRLARPAPTA